MRSPYRLPDASSSPAGVGLGVLGFYLIMALVGSWIATQYAAHCLNYSPNLGPSRVWYLYDPWKFYQWWFRYRGMPVYRPIWRIGIHIIEVAHLAFAVAAFWSVYRGKKLERRTDAHGSSRWAETEDIKDAGLIPKKPGIILGLWKPTWWKRGTLIIDSSDSHVAIIGPTGEGKDVGPVKSTLMTLPGTVVAIDPKGEGFTESAGYWKQQGYTVVKIDPSCTDGSAAKYNPLLAIRPYPHDVRDAQLLLSNVMDPHGKGLEKHWDRTGWDFGVACVLHQLYAEEDKSLAGVLHTLTNPHYKLDDTLAYMMHASHDPTCQQGWVDSTTKQPTPTHPDVASGIRALLNKHEEERTSVVSSFLAYLSVYRDPILAKNTSTSDLDPSDLLDPQRPVRLYLTTPMSDLARVRPVIRLWLQQFTERLSEKLQTQTGSPKPLLNLSLVLNEVAAFGRLDFLEHGVSWLRGYGVRITLVLQDPSQLDAIYGRDNTLLANCRTLVAFRPAPTSTETAQKLSTMCGSFTYTRIQNSYSGNRFSPWLGHQIATTSEQKRELLTADEVRRLPHNKTLVFSAECGFPILADKVRYYRHPSLLSRSRIPPPRQSDTLTRDKYGWLQRPIATRPQPQSPPKQKTPPPTPVTVSEIPKGMF